MTSGCSYDVRSARPGAASLRRRGAPRVVTSGVVASGARAEPWAGASSQRNSRVADYLQLGSTSVRLHVTGLRPSLRSATWMRQP